MKLNFLIGLFALFSLVSCVDYNDVQFNDVKNIEVRNSGSQNMLVDVTVGVANDARAFTIKEATIEAVNGNKIYASVSLMNKVKVQKGDNENLVLPLRINLSGGLLGAAAFVMNAKSVKYNVSVKLKSFMVTKEYQYSNLTSSEVEKIVGIDINKLIKR